MKRFVATAVITAASILGISCGDASQSDSSQVMTDAKDSTMPDSSSTPSTPGSQPAASDSPSSPAVTGSDVSPTGTPGSYGDSGTTDSNSGGGTDSGCGYPDYNGI